MVSWVLAPLHYTTARSHLLRSENEITLLRTSEPRIANLVPPARLRGLPQQQNLALLDALNRRHLDSHPAEADLEARIASYELAAKMQTAAKERFDIGEETEATQKLYGLDDPVTRKMARAA